MPKGFLFYRLQYFSSSFILNAVFLSSKGKNYLFQGHWNDNKGHTFFDTEYSLWTMEVAFIIGRLLL